MSSNRKMTVRGVIIPFHWGSERSGDRPGICQPAMLFTWLKADIPSTPLPSYILSLNAGTKASSQSKCSVSCWWVRIKWSKGYSAHSISNEALEKVLPPGQWPPRLCELSGWATQFSCPSIPVYYAVSPVACPFLVSQPARLIHEHTLMLLY